MDISHDSISRIQINLSITLIRTISINVRESLSHTGIKDTKAIKAIALR